MQQESGLGTAVCKTHHVSHARSVRAVCARLRAGLRGFFFGRRRDVSQAAPDLQAAETLPCLIRGHMKQGRSWQWLLPHPPSTGGTSRVMFSLLPVALMLSALLEVKPRSWLWDFCDYNLSRANTSREVWQAKKKPFLPREPELWPWQPGFG